MQVKKAKKPVFVTSPKTTKKPLLVSASPGGAAAIGLQLASSSPRAGESKAKKVRIDAPNSEPHLPRKKARLVQFAE